METPVTLKALLDECVDKYSDNIALQSRAEAGFNQISYRELGEKVAWIRNGLLKNGYKKGDKIALLGKNSPEWALTYLAVVTCGITLVPVDSLLKVPEIKHVLHDSEACALFVSAKFAGDILEERDDLPQLRQYILLDGRSDTEGVVSLPDFQTNQARELPEVDPADLAVLIYTSGTTGKSKGVMLTHRNIASNVVAALKRFSVYPTDRLLSVLPLHHTFEATTGFLVALRAGGMITYARSLKSKEMIEDIRDSGTTIMVGVPLLFEKMLNGIHAAIKKKPKSVRAYFNTGLGLVRTGRKLLRIKLGRAVFRSLRRKAGINTLRLFVCGGAPMAPYIQAGFEELGINLVQGYGATEAAPVISANPEKKAKPNSIGLPLDGVDIRLVDLNDEGIGEIAVRGDNIMSGYYKNPEASEEVLRDGWLYTGDLGRFDDEGYLYITGRKKNLIVTGAGKNVYPEEIEIELDKNPFIAESLVVGSMDLATKRENVHAIIVPDYDYLEQYAAENGLKLDEKGVKELVTQKVRECCSRMAEYKRIKDIEIRDEEFAKTSTRKIKRYLYQQKSIELQE